MRRVELPGGGWADFREQEDLTMRERRLIRAAATMGAGAVEKVEKAVEGGLPDDPDERLKALEKVDITTLGLSFEDADALQYMQAAAIVAGLADWSRSEPLPTMQTVWDIKDEQLYDFLSEETRRLGAVRDVDFDPNPHDEDPANPTGRLSDSSGSSSEQEDPEALQPISSTSTTNSSSVA